MLPITSSHLTKIPANPSDRPLEVEGCAGSAEASAEANELRFFEVSDSEEVVVVYVSLRFS